MKNINIAKQFSRHPAGRYKEDGNYTGQHFRENFLVPAIKNEEETCIEFDGTRGYGSSFLEEAFGGLVREGHSADKIYAIFNFSSSDPSLEHEIKDYINNADNAR